MPPMPGKSPSSCSARLSSCEENDFTGPKRKRGLPSYPRLRFGMVKSRSLLLDFGWLVLDFLFLVRSAATNLSQACFLPRCQDVFHICF